MRHFLAPAIIVATLVIPAACAKQPAAATAPKLVTDDDKTLYALGVLMSRSLESFELSPQEVEFVKEGLGDSLNGKPTQVDADKLTDSVQSLYKKRMDALVQKDK